jgi:NAD(P)-dependent dehydrogenase (short-subunit alcohol dehydrogenase family)
LFADAGWQMVRVHRRQADCLVEVVHFIVAGIPGLGVPERIFGEFTVQAGRSGALVNNVVIHISRPRVETTLEEWDATMASKILSAFLAARYVCPSLRQSRGAIVNVSSVHAVATSVGIVAYAAS